MKKLLPIVFFVCLVAIFFKPFLFNGMFPIPSDTIIGLYNPYRDLYAQKYPRGVPFKNFLITDPVRQEYPWRYLAIYLEKSGSLPLWNPYNFSGTPLLANFQSSVFYPLNILFFIMPFSTAWSLLVFLQPLLGGIFLYFYLRNLKLHTSASFLGAIAFSFSGFSIAWLEWNTLFHVLLWLPLLLLSVDKVFNADKNLLPKHVIPAKAGIQSDSGQARMTRNRSWIKSRMTGEGILWNVTFLLALASSFFAGHVQTFFYVFVITVLYIMSKLLNTKDRTRIFLIFALCFLLFAIITSFQWIPTLQFILHSARDIDQNPFQNPGWFIPWQHLAQFIFPDFFGNPTTLNYWGVWNYAEFSGYIGILPLLFAITAIVTRRDKKTFFWTGLFVAGLLFALPTPIAQLPFILHIPLLSTAQPTRLLALIDFSLAILAALGLDMFLKKPRSIVIPAIIVGIFIALGWGFAFMFYKFFPLLAPEQIVTTKHNLVFPTLIFCGGLFTIFFWNFLEKKAWRKLSFVFLTLLMLISFYDAFRFAQKFTPFTQKAYLFPQTKVLEYLQQHIGNFRVMETDAQILPPNFSVMYQIQSIDGYDPLYLKTYGEFIAAMNRHKPDISSPFGFNRIITPQNIDSPLVNLLGVKYVLSLKDIGSSQYKKVFQEGQTQVYENTEVLPRAFLVSHLTLAKTHQEAINKMFSKNFDAGSQAITEGYNVFSDISAKGSVSIVIHKENKVVLQTATEHNAFLVLTDSYYPTWHAFVDGKETQIFVTDFTFRGVQVPKGTHTVVFEDRLF